VKFQPVLALEGKNLHNINTSTAFLILESRIAAIMLGRLRMNISDCFTELSQLFDSVVGRRRSQFFLHRPLRLLAPRYNARTLTSAVQRVVEERVANGPTSMDHLTFASDPERCKTYVTVATLSVPFTRAQSRVDNFCVV
jgi:hypothetical protein